MEEIVIGKILKPQGVRGELKVQPLTDDAERFRNLRKVLIDGREYGVITARLGGEFVYITLNGIADRNVAEEYRNKTISVRREDAVSLESGRYFIVDITGSAVVFEDGEALGTIEEVVSAKTDYFVVKTLSGKVVRFPFLKDLTVKVDIISKQVIIKRQRYNEVACYED